MDLSAPLRTIGSPVEAEVLRVLAGADAEFAASQIHRLVDRGSAFGVRKALDRLGRTGLVHAVPRGGTTLFRGNRAHLLWPGIESMVRAREVLRSRLICEVERHEGVLAYLYGSYARGTAGPDSDLDLLLVFPEGTSRLRQVDVASSIEEAVGSWTGNRAETYSTTRSELQEAAARSDPILGSFGADAVALVGPAFRTLVRRSAAEEGSSDAEQVDHVAAEQH